VDHGRRLQVGKVVGAAPHQGVNVTPDYGLGQKVRAWAKLCNDPSLRRSSNDTIAPPNPLPSPAIDPAYEGTQQIRITNLVNGARFELVAERNLARHLAHLGRRAPRRPAVAARKRRHALGRAADVPRRSAEPAGRHDRPAVLGAAGAAGRAGPVRRHVRDGHADRERRDDQGVPEPREGG